MEGEAGCASADWPVHMALEPAASDGQRTPLAVTPRSRCSSGSCEGALRSPALEVMKGLADASAFSAPVVEALVRGIILGSGPLPPPLGAPGDFCLHGIRWDKN